METIISFYQSPLGTIRIEGSEKGISGLYFETITDSGSQPEGPATSTSGTGSPLPNSFAICIAQLEEYFAGKRLEFEVPLAPEGTEFQRKVWDELLNIPFGETRSYLDIAESLGDRNSTRAVGNANGKNRVSIIIPCHRVVGSDGKLTGYAGGLWRKKWLLKHEHEMRYGKQGTLAF